MSTNVLAANFRLPITDIEIYQQRMGELINAKPDKIIILPKLEGKLQSII